jgi:hypothetical protein
MAMALRPPISRSAAREAASTSETQSHMTLPPAVRAIRARWPMAIEGLVASCSSPGSSSVKLLERPSPRNSSMVAHCWPPHPTYWRSSSQIGHRGGGWPDGAYWTPQVRQM